jgi:hypothetical protein
MNELLFFGGFSIVVGLSYYLGHKDGIKINMKMEVRQFIHDMTVSKMAHDHFMKKAQLDTIHFLKFLGVKNPKNIKIPKIIKPEDFDKQN